jgi:membrane protein DedA with SNARE-associated domain
VLIANGDFSPWIFFPAAIVCVTAGCAVGHAWSRVLGARGVRALAVRFRAAHHFDRVSDRLAEASPLNIALCRLVPGMRINTTLIAGAARVDRQTFLLGVFPAIVVWVFVFTSLGIVAGHQAERILGKVDRWAIQGIVLIAIGLGIYLAARFVPSRRDIEVLPPARWERFLFSAAVDLAAIASVAAGLQTLASRMLGLGEPDGSSDLLAIAVGISVVYVVLTRAGLGLTAGEALFRVRYRKGRRLPPASIEVE